MARRKSKTQRQRRYRKKRYMKKSRHHAYNTAITRTLGRGGNIYPDRLRLTMRYADYVTPPSVGIHPYYSHIINHNSVYDPDADLGGDSPMGFATLSNLYNWFFVSGSAIEVEPITPMASASAASCVVVNVCPYGSQETAVTVTDNPQANQAEGQLRSKTRVYSSSNTATRPIKSYASTRQLEGLPHDIILNNTYWGQGTGNPDSVTSWAINAWDPAFTTNLSAANLALRIKVVYYVTWFSLNTINNS